MNRALLWGGIAGTSAGTAMVAASRFTNPIYPLRIMGWIVPCYAAVSSLALNLAVAIVLSAAFNAPAASPQRDATTADDYA